MGVHVGWRGSAETVRLAERGTEGRVHQLVGYRDVRPIDVTTIYYRRIQMSEPVAAAHAAGTSRGLHWLVRADAARQEQRLWREEANDPASDRWTANAWGAGIVLQRAFAGGAWLVTGTGDFRLLVGDADLAADSTGAVFTADERVSSGTVEVRWTPASPWRALALVSLAGDRRRRRDMSASIRSDLESRTPRLAAEGAWKARQSLELLAGVSYGRYQARGEIPQPVGRGAVYRRLIAPELQLYATESSPRAMALSARWRLSGATVWGTARRELLSASPLSTSISGAVNRRATSVIVGVSKP